MPKFAQIASTINLALYAVVSCTGLMVSTASFAATSSNIERIEVTGSYIKRQDWESASPITVIDAATINAQGFTSIEQILQQQPSMPGSALGASSNNGARGVAQVDLRGLGAKRTLVLLNGRRMVNSGSGADSSVDLNAIPLPMVARIEILKDGASAVYGSDAIAGVVNIITHSEYDGLQVDVTSGVSAQGDGQTQLLSAIYGVNSARGNYSVGVVFADRAEVMQGDRDWYKPTDHNSSSIPSGTLNGMVQDENGQWIKSPHIYNYADDVYFQTPNERRSVFASMNHTLDHGVVVNVDALYTNRRSNQQLSGQPARINLNVCDPFTRGDCVLLDDAMLAAGIGANALGQVQYLRRMSEVGPRIYSQDTDTWQLSAGLAGHVGWHRGLDWRIDYGFGKNQADTAVANSIHADWMAEAIYADQASWFSGEPLTEAMMDAVSFTERTRGGNEQQTLLATTSGELVELSAGAIEFALGAEYRSESGYFYPDPIMIAGQGTAPRQAPTDGRYHVFSVFQELSVPFSEALNGQFALRLDDYSSFGLATTWKVGLTYQTTADLMLRAVASSGFRAPNVAELYGGNQGSFENLIDPWSDNAKPQQILVNRTADPDLKPENAKSYTLGLVYSPQYLDGLALTLDYWRVAVTDAVSRLDVQAGIHACYAGDINACTTFNITPAGDMDNITSRLTNVGLLETAGVDMNVTYRINAAGLEWTAANDTTYLMDFEQDNSEYAGTIDGSFGAYGRVRNHFTMTASAGNWGLWYLNRYLGPMSDLRKGNRVGSSMYHDISGTYRINEQAMLTLGVRNLSNTKPQRVSNGKDAGTVPEVYDTVGRTFYAGVSLRF